MHAGNVIFLKTTMIFYFVFFTKCMTVNHVYLQVPLGMISSVTKAVDLLILRTPAHVVSVGIYFDR